MKDITFEQERILESLSYYFKDYENFSCNYYDEAEYIIKRFRDRLYVTESSIYIDDKLISKNGSIHPYAPKFDDIPEEYSNDIELEYEDIYDPYDMSTWDDDDWVNFELEH